LACLNFSFYMNPRRGFVLRGQLLHFSFGNESVNKSFSSTTLRGRRVVWVCIVLQGCDASGIGGVEPQHSPVEACVLCDLSGSIICVE